MDLADGDRVFVVLGDGWFGYIFGTPSETDLGPAVVDLESGYSQPSWRHVMPANAIPAVEKCVSCGAWCFEAWHIPGKTRMLMDLRPHPGGFWVLCPAYGEDQKMREPVARPAFTARQALRYHLHNCR